MKKEDIMKAVSDIDDKYILEAAEEKEKQKVRPKVTGRRIAKWAGAVAALLAVVIIGNHLINSGLFSNYKDETEPNDDGYYSSDTSYYGLNGLDFDSRKTANAVSGGASNGAEAPSYAPSQSESEYGGNTDGSSHIYNPSKVKLIYTANVTAQTTDFAAADAYIKDMVNAAGGYFENQSVSNGTYYNGDYLKKASYTVRVPAEKFEEFLNGVGEKVTVKSLNQYTEDVGLSYSETEQRLETLNIKLDRLQELLSQATNMTDIITIENEISYTEEDIEFYTNKINRYDSLIGFSTITIDLTEVANPGSGVGEKEGFFKKLGRKFAEGLSETGDNFANFFYWISYNFVGILIFAAIVFCLIKFRPFTKLFRKLFKKEQ